MLTATKIRIYPNAKQEVALACAFGSARWYWNNSLAEIQAQYHATGKGLGQYALNSRLPGLKRQYEWLGETHSQVLQSVSLNLSRAFINFFEKRAKYPNFKSKHGRQTIQYPQGVKIVEGRKLFLPKIGHIKAIIHREIVGIIKTVTVSREPSGKYFASILSDTRTVEPEACFTGRITGIDVGLTDLAVTSSGSKFNNPKHLARAEKNLKRKQQKLSRKTKGSNARNKARKLVARAHEKAANARKDFLHKLSRRLVDENQVLAVEDLNVKGMMQNHCLAKGISDVGWGMFTNFLEYKTARAGKGFIRVDRWYPSSKICSDCGHPAPIPSGIQNLSIRTWKCNHCGSTHDRDVNAARNIALEAQRIIAAGMAETANGGLVSRGRGRKSSVHARANEVGSPCL